MISPVTAAFNNRMAADGNVFAWPFERSRKTRRISVDGRVMVNDPDLAVRAAVDGLGIAYTIEALAEPFLRSGQLVSVLEDWSPSFEGLFLYYPVFGIDQTFTSEPFYQGVSKLKLNGVPAASDFTDSEISECNALQTVVPL